MKSKYIFVILLLVIGLFACKKNKDNPSIRLNGLANEVASEGEKKTFTAFAIAHNRPATLFVELREDGETNRIYDTIVDTEETTFRYKYTFLNSQVNKELLFTFGIKDSEGLDFVARKSIKVNPIFVEPVDTVALTETFAQVIYSRFSFKPSAFNIQSKSPKFETDDSTLINFADYDTVVSDSSLMLSFNSLAGNSFVRFNSFDYDNATNITVKNSYENGVKSAIVNAISIGDILLTKYAVNGENKYAAIKITNIIEDVGVDNDRYQFNLKSE